MTTVYKVVRRRRDGKLASALTGLSDVPWRTLTLIYGPNQKTIPREPTKILAFKEKGKAERWAEMWSDEHKGFEVWEALAVNATPCHHLVDTCWEYASSVFAFWAGKEETEIHGMKAPPGTVACDSITLIKRVDGAE